MDTLLINIDMKKNQDAIEKINHLERPIKILLIIDVKITEIVADLMVEKGWLGDSTAREIQQNIINNKKIMREKWEKYANQEITIPHEIQKKDGNIRYIIEQEIEKNEIKTIIITYKKGFNPYYETIEPVIKHICEKHDIQYQKLT